MDISIDNIANGYAENIAQASRCYLLEKDSRIDAFERLRNKCEASTYISNSIRRCWGNSEILKGMEAVADVDAPDDIGGLRDNFKLLFTKSNNAVSAIMSCEGQRTALVVGVSKLHQGGGVLRGEITCEAELCRHSTLYFCLQAERIQEEFYKKDRFGEYVDDRISGVYLPGVMFFKEVLSSIETDAIYTDVLVTDIPDAFNNRENTAFSEAYRRYMPLKLSNLLRTALLRGIDTLIVCDEQREYF